MEEKKYPIGGFAPGNYYNRCTTCERSFFGDKRAVQCEPCALEAKARFDALDPNDKELLIKRNARIANYMFSGPLSAERDLIYRIVEQWGNAVEMPNMEQWLKDYALRRGCAVLPANDAAQNWFEENIDKECSASSAVYKFRQWLESLQVTRQAEAVWVKASIQPPIGHSSDYHWRFIHNKKPINRNFHIESGRLIQEYGNTKGSYSLEELEWLDEQPASAREEDAIGFAEWAATIAFFDDGTRLWELLGEGEAINGQFRFTTKEFYQVFKQQKDK